VSSESYTFYDKICGTVSVNQLHFCPGLEYMLTTVFILTRIIANPLSNVFQKKLTNHSADPIFIILATHLLLTVVTLPILLCLLPLKLSGQFWWNIGICALLASGGNILIVAALKSTDLSVLGPINSYKSIVSLILGVFLLGEFPKVLGIAGILMILAGNYFIMDKETDQPQKGVLTQFLSNPGVRLRFAALVLSATEAVFLKKALLISTPLVTFLFWCILGVPMACIAMLVFMKTAVQAEVATLTDRKVIFLSLAITTGLMQLSTLYTFSALQVGYSLALFQTSTLLSVVFGYRFFQEKNIARRLLGAIIMVVGAVFIVVFGSRA
jgi:drug/metabolite transporter (DMT)-like permease